jgi:hypothetical protein
MGRPATVLRQWLSPVFSPGWWFHPRLKDTPFVSGKITTRDPTVGTPSLSFIFSHPVKLIHLLSFSISSPSFSYLLCSCVCRHRGWGSRQGGALAREATGVGRPRRGAAGARGHRRMGPPVRGAPAGEFFRERWVANFGCVRTCEPNFVCFPVKCWIKSNLVHFYCEVSNRVKLVWLDQIKLVCCECVVNQIKFVLVVELNLYFCCSEIWI